MNLSMTNSNKNPQAIIDDIFKLIDEALLQKKIDHPIEKAAASFKYNQNASFSYKYFLRVAGRFVQHLYEHAFGRKLNLTQASAEMIHILESGYSDVHSEGFYVAYLDAMDPTREGFVHVLSSLVERITTKERIKYVRWVILTRIDPSDWAVKCHLVKAIKKSGTAFLPQTLNNGPSAQLAGHLPELISAVVSTDRMVSKLFTPHIELVSF